MINRKKNRHYRTATVALLATGILFLSSVSASVSISKTQMDTIVISKQALYPEGLEYNSKNNKFIVGSFREGAVYEVAEDGSYRQLIKDQRLKSVVGIRVDAKSNRLFIANSDIGASIKTSEQGPMKLAALGIYDLTSGEKLNFVDLGSLRPQGKHLANAIAVDPAGNAYVTDSFSPIIYKVDPQGKASVFLENDRFRGEGINLNGIAYHPDGYFIVAKKGEGVLFKIPLAAPETFSEIKLPKKLTGADGLILADNNELVVISNIASGVISNTAFSLKTSDGWKTAKITDQYQFDNVYPTTGILKNGNIYVVHSNLNELMRAPKAQKAQLRKKATIQQIGSTQP